MPRIQLCGKEVSYITSAGERQKKGERCGIFGLHAFTMTSSNIRFNWQNSLGWIIPTQTIPTYMKSGKSGASRRKRLATKLKCSKKLRVEWCKFQKHQKNYFTWIEFHPMENTYKLFQTSPKGKTILFWPNPTRKQAFTKFTNNFPFFLHKSWFWYSNNLKSKGAMKTCCLAKLHIYI